MFHLLFFVLFHRLRQEFGIVKKLEKKFFLNNVHQNNQNICNSEETLSNINSEKISTSNVENIKYKFECSHISCDCPRCRNMDGN